MIWTRRAIRIALWFGLTDPVREGLHESIGCYWWLAWLHTSNWLALVLYPAMNNAPWLRWLL